MGRALAAGRRRLARGSAAWLLVAGGGLTLAVAAAAALAGGAVERAAESMGLAGLLLEAVALKMMFAVRGLARAAGEVRRALDRGDLDGARSAVGRHLVSRPTADLDPAQTASAAIESVAENVTDALVAPLLFYVVLGLPGAAGYRAINTADAMLGYREGVLEHFGKASARLDDALNWLPARLAAALLGITAPFGRGRVASAFSTAFRDHRRTASPNAGWTMAAMAGALGVVLEKRGDYRLGEGGARPASHDITRSVRIALAACGSAVVLSLVMCRLIT